jgi:hypothetical protein
MHDRLPIAVRIFVDREAQSENEQDDDGAKSEAGTQDRCGGLSDPRPLAPEGRAVDG